MKRFVLLAMMVGLAACSSEEDSESVVGDALSQPSEGCSQAFMKWAVNDLGPRLERPIGEASEAETMSFAAKHPAMLENEYTYSTCWHPLFTKYFGPYNVRLADAQKAFFDRDSSSYRNGSDYKANIALTPELRRNAKVLLSLRPKTMLPMDADVWTAHYNLLLGRMVGPLGIPDVNACVLQPLDPEWVIDDAEAESLAVLEEAARVAPSRDGVYHEWFESYRRWLFGPPPSAAVVDTFVFNLPGFGIRQIGDNVCDLGGVRFVAGHPTVPTLVRGFLDRWKSTMPRAIGETDSSAWMNIYNARALRALSDLRLNERTADEVNTLALDVLEEVKPPTLVGLFNYTTWLDLVSVSDGYGAEWRERFASLEPCVASGDLAEAKEAHAKKAASLKEALSAPHVCSQ